MCKLYSLPGSLAAILKSERGKYPLITDVDFGRARTHRGLETKARQAGYKPVFVSVDMGGEILITKVYCKD